MLKLIIKQANWGILGSLFGFAIGFVVKVYLIDIVGISEWGKYVSAHAISTTFVAFLAIGIPYVLLKFLPDYLEKDKGAANFMIKRSLRYAVNISIIFLIMMYFLAPYFDEYLYKEIEGFSFILLLASVHTPIAIFTAIITTLYRSIFKIKEIILYGTFVAVPLRAILTFLVFKFTENIIYFIAIELFTTTLSMILLYYFFNKKEISLLKLKSEKQKFNDDVIPYGKKVYANSLVSFFASQSLSLILSIMLPPSEIGVFSILLTITGISLFLIQNLNKVFAPAISKLYAEGKINELNNMFKTTTFIVNFITIPFTILIVYFAKELLVLYDSSGDILNYLPYLYMLMAARIIALLSGSSGTFMLMAGLEKKELLIQTVKAVLITSLALFFTKDYGLLAVVSLFIVFTLFINILQLFFIKRAININPFSKDLFLLIILSIPLYYYAINNANQFNIYQIFWVPILLYLSYFLVFYKSIRILYFDIFKND